MHHALAIQEIIQLIFGNFRLILHGNDIELYLNSAYDYEFQRKERNVLLNLALTCQAFKEPALDALWWAMNDLTLLFSLLEGYDPSNAVKLNLRPIDCVAFFSYANRIRLYHYCYWDRKKYALLCSTDANWQSYRHPALAEVFFQHIVSPQTSCICGPQSSGGLR
ncbi:hypothetical protein CPB84DRAFT_255025 [Gymnopilus junonius]|uniref:Uncharacterized protein n=1 Tax=Gymnopilus junonius TaxID=109634 RepID=A0A9P5THF7_GYMJU|nr:hypothetical protein CPB84DRAFT_255025 [Gymnopilus junonius]